MIRLLTMLTASLALALPVFADEPADDIVTMHLLPGWRSANGTHTAGLKLILAPGWKTYWRAPGDAGIPPVFDWSGSKNLKAANVQWPRPVVFTQSGMRSIGYIDSVVLPIKLKPRQSKTPITLSARIDIGICNDICVPKTIRFTAKLNPGSAARDPQIIAALTDRPLHADEGGAAHLGCRISPAGKGSVQLQAKIKAPHQGGTEHVAVETNNPLLWVAEPKVTRSGNTLSITTQIEHVEGVPFMVSRDGIRMTILGTSRAVELAGCPAG